MTTSDRMSDPMERLRAEIGYRMWCLDQGYMSDKDREGCDNWLLLPDSELHETDRRAKPEILELADSVIDALAAAGYRIVPIVDDSTRREIENLMERQTPHVCRSCDGTGWIDDEGWSDERWSRGQIEREEGEGLIPCGACGDWHTYRDEYTEPTTIVDGWTSEQESRAADLLAAAYLPPPRLTDASYSGRTYK